MARASALSASNDPLSHVVQHPLVERTADLGLFTPKGVITVLSDHITMLIAAALLLMLFVPLLIKQRRGTDEVGRRVPTGFGNFLEMICSYLREEVARPNLGEHTDRFVGYLWSVFFFIWTINLLGLLPLGAITPTLTGLHIGGTATANIWVTATLATLTVLMMVINGLRLGGKEYIAHFNPGPWWLAPLLVPLEIVGVFAKGVALAIRLFANMVAGHILLAVLTGFILSAGVASTGMGFATAVAVVPASIAVSMLEIFVATLQAFIFTMLTAVFLGQSVVFHHHDEHEGEGAH